MKKGGLGLFANLRGVVGWGGGLDKKEGGGGLYSDAHYGNMLFQDLLLHMWPLSDLFVLGKDRFLTVYIFFKEALFFIQTVSLVLQ